MGTIKALGGSTGQGHQHGLRWQCRLQSSTWVQVAAQTMDMRTILVITQASDTNMAPGSYRTMEIHMNPSLQHGLGQWTTDTKVASRGSMHHRGLSRRSNSEINHSSSWTSCCCSEPGLCSRVLHATRLALLCKDTLPYHPRLPSRLSLSIMSLILLLSWLYSSVFLTSPPSISCVVVAFRTAI